MWAAQAVSALCAERLGASAEAPPPTTCHPSIPHAGGAFCWKRWLGLEAMTLITR